MAGKTGDHFDDPNLWVDSSARIGRNVSFVGRNVVGARAFVGDGAVLKDSILWDDAQVSAGEHVADTVLAPGLALHILSRIEEPRQP